MSVLVFKGCSRFLLELRYAWHLYESKGRTFQKEMHCFSRYPQASSFYFISYHICWHFSKCNICAGMNGFADSGPMHLEGHIHVPTRQASFQPNQKPLLRYGQQLILKNFYHDPTRYLSSRLNYLFVR